MYVSSFLLNISMNRLDLFGNADLSQEYKRVPVQVSLAAGATAPAEVYLWTDLLSRLERSLWTFEDFLRDSAHRWVGKEGENRGEYREVDRRRAMNGCITPTGVRELSDKVKSELQVNGDGRYAEFGRKLADKYFSFDKGWINLNHGRFCCTCVRSKQGAN